MPQVQIEYNWQPAAQNTVLLSSDIAAAAGQACESSIYMNFKTNIVCGIQHNDLAPAVMAQRKGELLKINLLERLAGLCSELQGDYDSSHAA